MIASKVTEQDDYVVASFVQPLKKRTVSFAIDTDVWEKIQNKHWYVSSRVYISATESGKITPLHHFILPPRSGYFVDHINRNTQDNRRCNLRYVRPSENIANQGRFLKPGTGVSYNSGYGKWEARIGVDGKRIHLGFYSKKSDASKARKDAEMKYRPQLYLDVPKQVIKQTLKLKSKRITNL